MPADFKGRGGDLRRHGEGHAETGAMQRHPGSAEDQWEAPEAARTEEVVSLALSEGAWLC